LSFETLIAQEYGTIEADQLPALLRFADQTEHPHALRARAAVHAYYGMREHGSFNELLATLERLHQSADQLPDELAFQLGLALVSVQSEIGLQERARALTNTMRARFTEPRAQFRLLYYAFYQHRRTEEFDEAQRCLDALRAIDIEQIGPHAMAYYHTCRATLAEGLGDYETGREAFMLSIHIARSQLAQREEMASIIHNNLLELSRLMVRAGEFEQAALLCEDAIAAHGPDPAHHILSYALVYHGLAMLGAGQPRAAHASFTRAAEIAEQLPLSRVAAHAHLYMAWQAFVDARPDLMRVHLRACARHDAFGDRSCAQWLPPMQRLLSAYDHEIEPTAYNPDDPGAYIDQLRVAWLHGQPAPAPYAPHVIAEPLVRIAHSHLSARRARLIFSEQGDTLRVGDQTIALSKRGPLRRILVALCEARRSGQPWRSTVDLFEAGWPELEEVPANGFRRVYSELHRLKEWGVSITSGELGYRLDELPVSARELL
jgi:tetratricopeptide (TPR) repeat protein